eukprot:4360800-Pleurochrysis_carterae.AAC.1
MRLSNCARCGCCELGRAPYLSTSPFWYGGLSSPLLRAMPPARVSARPCTAASAVARRTLSMRAQLCFWLRPDCAADDFVSCASLWGELLGAAPLAATTSALRARAAAAAAGAEAEAAEWA